MPFRFFQWIRREFIRPLVTSKSSFSTGKNEPTESLLIGKEPKLTKKERRLKMFLQGVGVFLPSVYLGHVLSNHDIFGPSVKEKRRKIIAEEEREKALEQEKRKEEKTEEEDGQGKNEKKASDEEVKSKARKDKKGKEEKGDDDSKDKRKEDKNDKGNRKEAKDAGENDAK